MNKAKVRHRQRPRASSPSAGHDPHKPVGYGNPPKASQFKKGQSGNPKGRPKAKKSVPQLIEAALFAPVTVREGGRTRRIPTLEALLKRLRKDALEGDTKAIDRMMKLMQLQAAQAPDQIRSETPAFDPKEDQAILKEMLSWMEDESFQRDLDQPSGGG